MVFDQRQVIDPFLFCRTEKEDDDEAEDEDDMVIEQAWKRRKDILLHFHDLPSWSEGEHA